MRGVIAVLAGLIGWLCVPGLVHAHSGGVNGGGCGCHGNGEVDLDVDVSPMMFSPGEEVTVTVTVSQAGAANAGVFIDDDDVGSYATIGGQGLAQVSSGLTHTSAKSMSGGSAQFSFRWTAPNGAGAVRFTVWGVAGNGNGSSGGDDATSAPFDFVYGCTAQEFYRDADGDGFGRSNSPLLHCQGAAPPGYAPAGGDCDDNDPDQYPDAIEYCNTVDDDCDGEIDENALPLEQYPDADGDGFYGQAEFESGETFLGCVPSEGWAAEPGDCRPDDPLINPNTEETCNGFDDDCDNDVDEFVRPQCGEGWCRRESIGCDPDNCTPGEPREEECNFFDDDCDGIVDNDATCPAGETCQAGECRPEEPTADGDDDGSGDEAGLGTGGGATGTGAATDGVTAGAADDGGASGCGCTSSKPPSTAWLWLFLLGLRRRRGA
ncbi:MAG: choice-of-anchor V domain-containing protein [Myxococcota bacterium]